MEKRNILYLPDMKTIHIIYVAIVLACALNLAGAKAQVSHGGRPLPLSSLRMDEKGLFEEMPPFDVNEEMRIDSLNESDLRSGQRFAYKFITDLDRYNSGVNFTLNDGTKVWRLGIYSPGALSINLLFTEYELPEGASLYIYDEEQRQLLGSFNHLNNSDLNILPTSPIAGDRLIIEYQEPANAPFKGRLKLGEVNHAYRTLMGMEPGGSSADIDKIPPLACMNEASNDYARWGKSVVLMIIDGSVGCTGALVNNTDSDGKPYLLTASHCLNRQFTVKNPDYEKIAGSIVCFYNFDSPLCDPILRGAEEMSTASSYLRAIDEQADMALLELTATPPSYYMPYYAGWNIEGTGLAPFVCLQHPKFSVKRISISDKSLTPYTLTDPNMVFYKDAHLRVSEWQLGYTASGSSGSPLFNNRGEIIGALSGGRSTASKPHDDYFYSLAATWSRNDEPSRQLSYWLNSSGDNSKSCAALDPHKSVTCERLSNVLSSGNQEKVEATPYPGDENGYLFGSNSDGVTEYAEEYNLSSKASIHGVFMLTPPCGDNQKELEVEITIYSGNSSPEIQLHKTIFKPKYKNLSIIDNSFIDSDKPLNRSQENFIKFDKPVEVSGRVFIGYNIKRAPSGASFATYSLPKGASTRNSAWVKEGNSWKEATAYTKAGFSTSLFIDPVVSYNNSVSNESITSNDNIHIFKGATKGSVNVMIDEDPSGYTYSIYKTKGTLVASGKINNHATTINIPNIDSGIYIINVKKENDSYTSKIAF